MKNNISKVLLLSGIAITGLVLGVFLESGFPVIARLKTEIYSKLKKSRTERILWNDDFELVKIKSSLDKKKQSAYFYKAKTSLKAPLIVSLHSWSGDYSQFDSLGLLCKSKDINYIHPNFRGPNSTPDACCSKFVLSDIDDAISYAIQNSNVDTNKISIVGASGGGYAALCAYMKSRHSISKISAWAPIANLEAWYEQNRIRDGAYLKDILNCTDSKNEVLNVKKARDRSPFFWNAPNTRFENTSLFLYTGIYDGLQGSVPITQSINFYNKLLSDLSVPDSSKYVSEREKRLLLEHRKALDSFGKLLNRRVILRKKFENVKLVVYEGGHEILSTYALNELLGIE
ncbi:hypothetical protein FGF1_36170 [Flavobacteriaceae bacterium GF1]